MNIISLRACKLHTATIFMLSILLQADQVLHVYTTHCGGIASAYTLYSDFEGRY